jgi:hypothetical protein
MISSTKQRYDFFDAMETGELQEIWKRNDRTAWSSEAFETLERVLQSRGCPIDPQDAPTGSSHELPKSETISEGFRKLWRGEQKLSVAYWGYLVLPNVALRLFSAISGNSEVQATLAFGGMIYFGFVSVGIWRSANRYRGRRVWAYLAQGIVALNAIAFIAGIAAVVMWS